MAPDSEQRSSEQSAVVSTQQSAVIESQQRAVIELAPLAALLTAIGDRFSAGGHELALVGGPVRDALLGRLSRTPGADLDFTTDARPERILELLEGWAEATWDVGIRFGTIGARVHGREVEITTYRAESYDPASRKPEVDFGDSLEGDLHRRDFTINAMAVRLPDLELVDLFGGLADLQAGLLRTPGTATDSFTDDPLRMMRAARFTAQLGFAVRDDVVAAMTELAERLTIVSAERVREEFVKIVMSADPRSGLSLLVDTGLAEYVLPELPLLKLERDEHHHHKDVYEHTLTVLEQAISLETAHEPVSGPDPILRLAALMHDIGKPRTRRFEADGGVSFHHHEVVGARMTRKRMQALRFPNDVIDDVSTLVELHLRFHGYGSGEWTDSAVRRYVRDAGPLLNRLHKLTRADSTTRNRRRALALQQSYDSLERRIGELAQREELASMRPDLDGRAIMAILGIPPGPVVGEAYQFLLDLRLDRGPLDEELATEALLAWWAARPRRRPPAWAIRFGNERSRHQPRRSQSAHAVDDERAHRDRRGARDGRPTGPRPPVAHQHRRLRGERGSTRSGGAAGLPGAHPRAAAAAAAALPDVSQPLHLLPRQCRHHDERPGRRAAHRIDHPAVRRRSSVELRHVRRSGPQGHLRHQ